VPRDVDPAVNEMEGVFLYDIDSLQSIAEESLKQRQQQMTAGEQIIAQHVEDFASWLGRATPGTRASRDVAHPNIAEAPLRTSES
jgi:glutamyl-tRNA reductase